jgi:hypothetical protein
MSIKLGPFWVGSLAWWRYVIHVRNADSAVGIFRNLKWIKPGRWGFYFLGIEFGSRNPGNKLGLRLKRAGLWPW